MNKNINLFLLSILFSCAAPPDVTPELYSIRNNSKALQEISIKSPPKRTAYEKGESSYDLTGIVVNGKKINNEEIDVNPEELVLENFNSDSVGKKNVWVVFYGGVNGLPVKARLSLDIVRVGGLTGDYTVNYFEAGEDIIPAAIKSSFTGQEWDTEKEKYISIVTADVVKANEGDEVEAIAAPGLGFKLKEDSLRYEILNAHGEASASVKIQKTSGKYFFKMPAANIRLMADFELVIYRASVDLGLKTGLISIKNMNSSIQPAINSNVEAKMGDLIKITIKDELEAEFDENTLQYIFLDGSTGMEAPPQLISGREVVMPHGNISVTASFPNSSLKSVEISSIDGGNFEFNAGDGGDVFTSQIINKMEFIKYYEDETKQKLKFDNSSQKWKVSPAVGLTSEDYRDENTWDFADGPGPNNFEDKNGVKPFDSTIAGERALTFTIGGVSASHYSYYENGSKKSKDLKITVNVADAEAKCFDGVTDRYYKTLDSALELAAPAAGAAWSEDNPLSVTLLKSPKVEEKAIEVTGPKFIRLKAQDNTIKIFSNIINDGTFILEDGAWLSLYGVRLSTLNDKAVTIKGNSKFLMEGDAKVQFNGSATSSALICVEDGTFIMKDGKISSNSSNDKPFVYLDGVKAKFEAMGGVVAAVDSKKTTVKSDGGEIVFSKNAEIQGFVSVGTASVIKTSGVLFPSDNLTASFIFEDFEDPGSFYVQGESADSMRINKDFFYPKLTSPDSAGKSKVAFEAESGAITKKFVKNDLGGWDEVHIFDAPGSYSFELQTFYYAYLLVVGGGGGGSWGGGGAGGLGGLYTFFSNDGVSPVFSLDAGLYYITVGAGGAKGASGSPGAQGGYSSFGEISFLQSLAAFGGGGGSSAEGKNDAGAGGSGASLAQGVVIEGSAGGDGSMSTSPATDSAIVFGARIPILKGSYSSRGEGRGGGPGASSAITGDDVTYAHGGERGASSTSAGCGGAGGGAPGDGRNGIVVVRLSNLWNSNEWRSLSHLSQ
ncbi:MAG: hypothetical protein LBC53_00050 [Spirochaetaceae bacterium]|jgi:hypothetical protein|nr:hypothetical protein [Spirochaetaceae bacterium]